jgi:excisionase family DNA binding protein
MVDSSAAHLVSVSHAAGKLGVSPRFIRILGARGHLTVVRIGRRVLVPKEEVDRLAREGAPAAPRSAP